MLVEYIVEGSEYQSLIRDKIPKKGKKGPVSVTNKKISGVNNFILTIEYFGAPMESAELLSNIVVTINELFAENHVKHYVLRDEASITFANRLYPLVCEFETKLRKFLYIALFDLDDAAQRITTEKIKAVIKNLSKTDSVPSTNFLEEITLGEVFNLLFDNKEFLDLAKTETKQIEATLGRKATKRELIEKLEAIEEKTLWNELFQPSFPDFNLQSVQNDLFTTRNAVMHFHFIDYQQYIKALKLFKKMNKELDAQITKGIVLESSTDRIELVSNNYQYTFTAISAITEAIQAVNEQFDAATISNIAAVIKAISTMGRDIVSSIYDVTNGIYSALAEMYDLTSPNNWLEEPKDQDASPTETETPAPDDTE